MALELGKGELCRRERRGIRRIKSMGVQMVARDSFERIFSFGKLAVFEDLLVEGPGEQLDPSFVALD